MKALTADKLIESFPHPTMPPVLGLPTCKTIAPVHLKLNANAASMHSNRGNGKIGLLFLTLQPAVLNTLSTPHFDPPTNPGPNPTIPEKSTSSQIADLRRTHDFQLEEFNQFDQADKALKSILINTFDEIYIRSLRHRHIGYANVTTLTIIQHLYDNYANITEQDLNHNDDRLKTPYDAGTPFETLIDQVEDAIEFAAAGKTPYSKKQIVNATHNLVFSTGVFDSYCKEWRQKDEVDKTWSNFKSFFHKAHQDLRLSQACSTVSSAGYQANNVDLTQSTTDTLFDQAIQEEAGALEAIANLATASASDKSTMSILTATNATLTATNATLVKETSFLRKEIYALREAGSDAGHRKHYCWSCGTSSNHPSHKCTTKKDGHKNGATAINKMGGETRRFRQSA